MTCLPFFGRCISPLPEPREPRFEAGRRVVWSADREKGTLIHVAPESITVRWDESVRRENHEVESPPEAGEVRRNTSGPSALPEDESRRGPEHGRKAGNGRTCQTRSPARPA